MIISNSLKLQESKSFVIKKLEVTALFQSMTAPKKGGRFSDTAIRVRAIRRASTHPTPELFCNFLGIERSRLSNVENGMPISSGLQDIIIRKMPWVKRDFLMDGDLDALTGHWRQTVEPLLAEESDTTAPRRRSRSSIR